MELQRRLGQQCQQVGFKFMFESQINLWAFIYGDALNIHDGFILKGSWKGYKQLQLWNFQTIELIQDINLNANLIQQMLVKDYCAQFQKSTEVINFAGGFGINKAQVNNLS